MEVLFSRSTGRTTAHLGDYFIYNHNETSGKLHLEAGLIPPRSGFQGYIIPRPIDLVIGPKDTVVVPVYGYCFDPHHLPVPEGESLPPLDDWTTPGKTVFTSKEDIGRLASARPITEGQSGNLEATIPGTETPIGYRFEIMEQPEETTGLLIDIVERIETTYDSLNVIGAISTPFQSDPEKQREAVIQQTIWLAISIIDNAQTPYIKEDFHDNMVKQYEAMSGIDYEESSEEVKDKIEQGADEFWSSFELVGKKAKVLKEKDPSGGITEPSAQNDTEKLPCHCSECDLQGQIRAYLVFGQRTVLIQGDNVNKSVKRRIRFFLPNIPESVACDCGPSPQCRSYIDRTHDDLMYLEKPNGHRMTMTDWDDNTPGVQYDGNPFDTDGNYSVGIGIKCVCQGVDCGTDSIQRILRVSITNDCCDFIRENNGGQLRFLIDPDGHITLSGRTIRIHRPGHTDQNFNFAINVEDLFCGLRAGRGESNIISELIDQQLSRYGQEGSLESRNTRHLAMEYTNESRLIPDAYNLSFMTSETLSGGTAEEIGFWVSVNDETCEATVSLLTDGRYQYHAPVPYPTQTLRNIIQELPVHSSFGKEFWNAAYFLFSQMAALHPGSRNYGELMGAFRNKLRSALENRRREGNLSRSDRRRIDQLLNTLQNGTDEEVNRSFLETDVLNMIFGW